MNISPMTLIRKTSQNILRGFLFLSLLLIFLSCATVSSGGPARENPVTFAVIEAVEPQWQPFSDSIDCFHGRISNPRLEFWALRVDLAAPNMRIVVKGGTETESGTLSVKVSSFVRENNLAAGINALPFDVVSSREGRPIKNIGLVISESRLISPANPVYDALVFYKNGQVAIVNQSSIHSIENIENAVGGFFKILDGGEAAERTQSQKDRHPRSAAGISANDTFLYLLVIDGRRAGSEGSTEKETAFLLRTLGCLEGINFDGGGSSALALRYPDGSVKTANQPVHNGFPGRERAVAGCLGIALR